MNMRWVIGATAGSVLMVWCTFGYCGVVELSGGPESGGIVMAGTVTRSPGAFGGGSDVLLEVGCAICRDSRGENCVMGDYYDGGTRGVRLQRKTIVSWPGRTVEYWANAVSVRNRPWLSFTGVCKRRGRNDPDSEMRYAKMIIGDMQCYTCVKHGWDNAVIHDATGGIQTVAISGAPGNRYNKHWEGVSRLETGQSGRAKVWYADSLRLEKFGVKGTIIKVLETAGMPGVQISVISDVDELECRANDAAGPVVYPGPKVVILKNQEGIVCENALGTKGEQVGSITVDVSVL